jgi:hypothetical protein
MKDKTYNQNDENYTINDRDEQFGGRSHVLALPVYQSGGRSREQRRGISGLCMELDSKFVFIWFCFSYWVKLL